MSFLMPVINKALFVPGMCMVWMPSHAWHSSQRQPRKDERKVKEGRPRKEAWTKMKEGMPRENTKAKYAKWAVGRGRGNIAGAQGQQASRAVRSSFLRP
jgi:hypothetical protein